MIISYKYILSFKNSINFLLLCTYIIRNLPTRSNFHHLHLRFQYFLLIPILTYSPFRSFSSDLFPTYENKTMWEDVSCPATHDVMPSCLRAIYRSEFRWSRAGPSCPSDLAPTVISAAILILPRLPIRTLFWSSHSFPLHLNLILSISANPTICAAISINEIIRFRFVSSSINIITLYDYTRYNISRL